MSKEYLFVPFHGPNGIVNPLGILTAASQISHQVGVATTDTYITTNQKALASLTQSTILHEVLYNMPGLYDFVSLDWRNLYGYQPHYDLKTFVGVEVTPGIDPNPKTTSDIGVQLRAKGCAGAN